MFQVNLLPWRHKKLIKRLHLLIKLVLVMLCCEATFFIIFYCHQYEDYFVAQAHLVRQQQQQHSLQQQLQQIETYTLSFSADELQKQREQHARSRERLQQFQQLLNQLANTIPPACWLMQLTQPQSEHSHHAMQLHWLAEGNCQTMDEIVKFTKQLQMKKALWKIVLEHAEKQVIGGWSFALNIITNDAVSTNDSEIITNGENSAQFYR